MHSHTPFRCTHAFKRRQFRLIPMHSNVHCALLNSSCHQDMSEKCPRLHIYVQIFMATIKQIPKDDSLTVSTNVVSMQYPNTIPNTKMTLRQLVRPIEVVSPEHSSDDRSLEFQITAPLQLVHPNMHKARSFPRSPATNTEYFHIIRAGCSLRDG